MQIVIEFKLMKLIFVIQNYSLHLGVIDLLHHKK